VSSSELANLRTTVYSGKLEKGAALSSNSKLQLLLPLLELFPNNDQLVTVGEVDHVVLNEPEQHEESVAAVERLVNTVFNE
jgi:hypothetical protein